ncbi:glycosyltransferase family 4 protein [Fibrobacter succinogenes]|uniref:glycosyltransferase family 4 protein n=1 Tax=Fibrobacter succinogenes TaxID=833 RepID=UPI001C62EB85|nr:glycosyltransferase family 4 protein [Fibrobacter succinogenes]
MANNSVGLYKFRKELLDALLANKHEVFISVPNGDFIEDMQQMGCHFIETVISRHGTNPFTDIALTKKYCSIIKSVKPDIVFTYTIKPNVYGGIACQLYKLPYVANVTGLGTAVENGGILQKITLALYRVGLRKAKRVFFQNLENQDFMLKHKVVKSAYSLLPGSGVNLDRYTPLPYPEETDGVHFVFISRIMREKGIEQYLDAAKYFKKKCVEPVEIQNSSLRAKRSYPQMFFHICGFCEPEYQGKLDEYKKNGIVFYHGMIRDIREILKNIHCTIHPSFYPEGISNVLLESCACARPIITTDRSGCCEVIEDEVNGFVVKQRDSEDLIQKIERFLALSNEQKMLMGRVGRAKVEHEFDRKIVIDAYMKEMENV